LPKTLLIIYYSKKGNTEKMPYEIAKGAEKEGVNAILKKVDDCTLNDLVEVDGLAIGSPIYYGNMAWQIKRLLDETILSFYTEGHSLKHKVCGCFTSVGAYDDGRECIRMLEFAFGFDLKMKIVPGIVLETKDVNKGNLATCYAFGQKIAQELAV
jgi:multimeric flavodoxin WrbA